MSTGSFLNALPLRDICLGSMVGDFYEVLVGHKVKGRNIINWNQM